MKRFVMQLSIFVFLFVCGFSIFFTFVFSFNSKTITEYRFEGRINKLIVGDSHTQTSINDKLLSNSKNISQKSEGLLFSYYKLKSLLPNNRQIDTVLLGISYHSFSDYLNEFHNIPDVVSWYFFIMPPDAQFALLMNSEDIFPIMQKTIIEGSENWINGIPDYRFLGGYEPYSTKIVLSRASVDKRINQQYYVNGKENGFFDENILYFERIVELCKELNVELIILNTPMHFSYKEKVPIKFLNEYNKIVKNSEVQLIEFDGLKFNDTDFVPDGDHLQESGAAIATIYLNELLTKSGMH